MKVFSTGGFAIGSSELSIGITYRFLPTLTVFDLRRPLSGVDMPNESAYWFSRSLSLLIMSSFQELSDLNDSSVILPFLKSLCFEFRCDQLLDLLRDGFLFLISSVVSTLRLFSSTRLEPAWLALLLLMSTSSTIGIYRSLFGISK